MRGYFVKSESRGVDTHFLQEVTILIAIHVDLGRVGLLVVEAARLADRLGERQGFDVERNFRVETEDKF